MEVLKKLKKQSKNSNVEEILNTDQLIDEYLGLDYEVGELEVDQSLEELYSGIDIRALQTSYLDYYQIFQNMDDEHILVDLGAGYCRGSLLANYIPKRKCISLELSDSRLNQALKVEEKFEFPKSIQKCNLLIDPIPHGNSYYLYFPLGRVMYQIIRALLVRRGSCVFVCESHGDVIPLFNRLPWFRQVSNFKASLPRHNDRIYKYEIVEAGEINWKNDFIAWYISNENQKLLIHHKLFHPILKESLVWIIPISETSLEFVNESFYLKDKHNRIINIQKDEPIINIEKASDSIHQEFIKEYLKDCKIRKCLIGTKSYYEMSDGSLQFVHKR